MDDHPGGFAAELDNHHLAGLDPASTRSNTRDRWRRDGRAE
jgi:hypothetical protein